MSLYNYSKSELAKTAFSSKSKRNILDLVKLVTSQDITYQDLETLNKLINYQPLAPLTGKVNEWIDVSGEHKDYVWQNSRCASVFKRKDGVAVDIMARVFTREDEDVLTCCSIKTIEFPYIPKTEYIKYNSPEGLWYWLVFQLYRLKLKLVDLCNSFIIEISKV